MTTKLIIIVFLLVARLINAQNDKLQQKGGFQDLKLEQELNHDDFIRARDDLIINGKSLIVPSFKYDFMYEGNKYQNIGDVKIYKIFIKLHHNKISEIRVVCEYNSLLLETTRFMFSKPQSCYSDPNWCFWESKDIRLEVKSEESQKLGAFNQIETLPVINIQYISKKLERERSIEENEERLKKNNGALKDY